tara:strand:+ start:1110 stop:1844 length:735 start_codon:yes stop_codon:yes gene_type:complete
MLIIDADLYLYRCLSATEEETHWGDDVWSLTSDVKIAKDMFTEQLKQFQTRLDDDDLILCMSSKTNFRKDIEPTYKGHRKKIRKPLGYVAMQDWLQHHYRCFSKPGLEADDCMGILSTKPENAGKAIIVSDDKDMQTIPGRLFRPGRDEVLNISELQADKAFYTQCLVGDPADGYAGLKGFGPKTAEKTLGARPAWSLVEQAYIKAGKTREDALLQARLARILRWEDWDSENHQPRLYQGGDNQ